MKYFIYLCSDFLTNISATESANYKFYIKMNERERIVRIMEEEKLNAKDFSQRVGIQPATISNIMNGRNNPSLDVLQRILNTFRMVSADWLVLGSGPMYRQHNSTELTLFDIKPEEDSTISAPKSTEPLISVQTNSVLQSATATSPTNAPVHEVSKIVVFYSDGTFEEVVK